MPEFILGARGHDFGRHDPETLFSSIGQAGFACTQLAFPKAVEGVKSYDDVTPALVEQRAESLCRPCVRLMEVEDA